MPNSAVLFFFSGDCLKRGLKQKYISSAFILMLSTVVVKVIGAVYKIPLTAYIGATGRGYFSIAYNLVLPIHALTMGAFPIALTKLVSTYDAKGNTYKIKALRKASKRLFFLVGLAGLAVMLIAAKPYSALISSSPKSIYTILALAPSVFFCCLCASHRAFAEGYLDMKATAVSQIIEALFKMVFGLLFARLAMSYLAESYTKYGIVLGVAYSSEQEALSSIYPITSAAAMLGVTLGSIVSYIYASVYTNCKYNNFPDGNVNTKDMFSELVLFSVPLVGATVIQSIATFADNASIQYCLSLCNSEKLKEIYNINNNDIYTYVYGIYSSALDFKNLVPSIVMTLGVTAVPAVSSAFESSSERFSAILTSIFKYTSVLSAGGGVLLALFYNDILTVFYSSSSNDIAQNASELLFLFGVTIMPCCVASTAVFCVQSLGYSKQTILPFAVSAIIRVLLNFLLISNVKYNILGCAISNFAGYFVIMIWNIILIKRKTHTSFSVFEVFIKPIFCATLSYFVVKIVRNTYFAPLSDVVELCVSVGFYVTFLVVVLVIFKCVSLNNLKQGK